MDFLSRKKIFKNIRENSILCAAVAGFVLLSSLTACGHSNAAVSKKTNASDSILNFKTQYVGDNSKVGGIIGALTVPEGITSESVELSTAEKPYGVTVNYKAKNGTQIDSTAWEYKNAAVMLSLIGNANEITFKLSGASCGKYKNLYSEFHYTRAAAEETLGKDFNKDTDSAENFKKFMKTLDTAKFGSALVDTDYAKTQAEQKFKIVSPDKLTYKDDGTVFGAECYMFSSESGSEFAVSKDGCAFFNLSGSANDVAQST